MLLDRLTRLVARPGVYSLISLSIVAGLAVIYSNSTPGTGLPIKSPTSNKPSPQAIASTPSSPASPTDVLIELPRGATIYDAQSLAVLGEVHSIPGKAGRRR